MPEADLESLSVLEIHNSAFSLPRHPVPERPFPSFPLAAGGAQLLLEPRSKARLGLSFLRTPIYPHVFGSPSLRDQGIWS